MCTGSYKIIFVHFQIVRSRKRPCERIPYKSPKQQRLDRNEAVEALLNLPLTHTKQTDAVNNTDLETPSTSDKGPESISEPVKSSVSVGVTCKPDTQDQTCQTAKPVTSDMVRLSVQNQILKNSLKVSAGSFEMKKPRKQSSAEGSPAKKTSEKFNLESLKNDDKMCKFYTGLTFLQFMCLWNFLGDCTKKINFWNSTVSNLDKTPSKRPGPKRAISPINQLFMTLVRLRLGLLHQDLSYRFGTSTRQVSTVIMTWIQLLYKQFSSLRSTMFASRSKVRKHLPKSFKKYKNIRCIIDCTEVHVQSPGNFEAQGNQYSSYKGYTSYKFLIAVAPNGAIVYVSDAFEGCISDKEIVLQSDFLDHLEPGDVVMADRGFLIEDLLNERQVKLIKPPFLGSRHRFTPQEEALTKDIAKHRIHVERSIERMKKFKILQRIVPQSLQPVFSQMVFVIACLVNFQDPLVK